MALVVLNVYGVTSPGRIGGKLSDGSYFVVLNNRGIYWSDDQGATWELKLTLTSSFAWQTNHNVHVVGDTIYVLATVEHADGHDSCYFYRVTYNPATHTFTAAAGPVQVEHEDLGTLNSSSIAKFANAARLLALYSDSGDPGGHIAEYSTNDGGAWTKLTNSVYTSSAGGGTFARPDGKVVHVWSPGTTGTFKASVFADTDTVCPAAVTYDPGATHGHNSWFGMDPTTGDIWGYVWDATERTIYWAKFAAASNTWATHGVLTPNAGQRPALNTYVYGHVAFTADGHRRIIYAERSLANTPVFVMEDEDIGTGATLFTLSGGEKVSYISVLAHNTLDYVYLVIYDTVTTNDTYCYTEVLNLPPTAPTDLLRADYDARDVGRFEWTFHDPDPGDTQGAFKLRIREVGTGPWSYAQSDGTLGAEVWVVSANPYFDLDADELTNGKTYEWQVATKDQLLVEGPYSELAEFDACLPFSVTAPLPADASAAAAQTVDFSGLYQHDLGTGGTLRVQADTVNTFDSGDLQTGTVAVASGNRGTVPLTLVDRGTWYWRIRAECGGDVGDWLPTWTVIRSAATIELVDPLGSGDADVVPMVFQARGYSDTGLVRLQWQTDTLDTFDGPNLEEQESALGASGTVRSFSCVYSGTTDWYWRIRAVNEDGTPGDWSGPYLLSVDTGGAVPTAILPDPEASVEIVHGQFVVEWSAILDHVLTPTQDPTLRLQVQKDTAVGFPDPSTETSSRVLGGQRASVTFPVTQPGEYYFRFRTLADEGNDSDWVTYLVAVVMTTHFVEPPTWSAAPGPRPNRVYCRLAGSSAYKTALLEGVPAGEEIDHWVEVPSGTTEAEAQSTANAILAALQAIPVSVSGPVPLNVSAPFSRLVKVQWWERDEAGALVMREEATLALVRKEHDVDGGHTILHLGDSVPPAEEIIARLLARLSRPS